jgi:peptidoglycan LD-endopeptidase CwlK
MADHDPTHLCMQLQNLYQQWLARCEQAGLVAHAIVTWRDPEDQDAAKAAGLSNAAAGQSPHNCVNSNGKPASRAFDYAIFDNGIYIKNGQDPRYAQAGAIGKSLGLVWGGDWLHPDWDHLELADWKNIK